MKSLVTVCHDFRADDAGAAFIEYTALLGVILAVGLAILIAVGGWTNLKWKNLCSTLGASGC